MNTGDHSRSKQAGHPNYRARETEGRNLCHNNYGPYTGALISWFSNLDILGTLMWIIIFIFKKNNSLYFIYSIISPTLKFVCLNSAGDCFF